MRSLTASTMNARAPRTRLYIRIVAISLLLLGTACSGGNGNGSTPDVIAIDTTSSDAGGVDVGSSDVGDPDTVDPDAVDPDVVDPDTVDPDAVDPDVVDPDTVDPDTVDPDTVDPDTTSATVAPGFLSSPARGAAGGRASSSRFTAVFAFTSAAPPTSSDEYLLNPSPSRVETP